MYGSPSVQGSPTFTPSRTSMCSAPITSVTPGQPPNRVPITTVRPGCRRRTGFGTPGVCLIATTTAPAVVPTGNGVCPQGSGCASTVYLRAIVDRWCPHRGSLSGTSRASYQTGSDEVGDATPGGTVTVPPRAV